MTRTGIASLLPHSVGQMMSHNQSRFVRVKIQTPSLDEGVANSIAKEHVGWKILFMPSLENIICYKGRVVWRAKITLSAFLAIL